MINESCKRVLIVEDEPINAKLSRRTLEKYGYDVLIAETGEKAVTIAETEPDISLILMDIDLGDGMDGTEAAEKILAKHDLPLVFLSSHTEPEIVERTEGITSYGYIVKNSGETVLIASMKMAFRLFDAKKREEARENKLRESEEKYRALFESTGSGIIVIEEDTTISLANEQFTRSLGYTRDEIENRKKWTEMVSEDDLSFMLKEHYLRREFPEKARPSYEFRFKNRNGELRNNLVFISMVPGTKRSIASLIDITEQKRAENAVRQNNDELTALNEELTAMNEEFEAANEELIDANERLEEKEEEYRLLFENSPSGIFILQNGSLKIFNGATVSIMGRFEEELQSRFVTEFIHRDDLDIVMESYNRILLNETDEVSFPFRMTTSSGSLKWIGIKAKYINWKGKNAALCFINDITGRKIAEEELQKSEAKYKRIFESVQDVYYQTDLNGIIVEISPSIEKYSGFKREELIGRPVTDVYCDPADRGKLIELLVKYGRVSDYELRLKSKDNRLIITSAMSHVVCDQGSKPSGVEGSLRDITERKRIEEILRDSEENYRLLVENSNSIILRMDRSGNIVFFNNFAEQFFGFTRDEITGRNILGTIVPEVDSSGRDLKRMITDIALNPDSYSQNENENIRKDGSRAWISWTNKTIKDSSCNVSEVLCIGNDITYRREAEGKIKTLLREKEIFLKETHHRIKNDMNAVYGFLYMQADEQSEPVCRDILYDASSRVMSMMVLYDRLYRNENHKELNIREYLPDLVNQITGVYDSHIDVSTDLFIEDFVLNSDILSPVGIIINELITNSMKYAFRGGLSGLLKISAVKKDNDVTISYQDNGPGLPDSFSIENSSGFGMQLVAMLVQQIDGNLQIERGSGVKFVISFKVNKKYQ